MTPSAARLSAPPKVRPELDAVVLRVADAAEEFARLPLPERIGLAEKILAGCVATAEGQVRAACKAKGLDFDSFASAEEWLGGPYLTIRNVRLLIETMGRLESGQPPIDPGRIRTRGGRTIVDVFPTGAVDRITYAGFGGEVWMLPGVKPKDVIERAASHYREPLDRRRGRVALVLGAGNVASIGAMDVLHKLFVEGHVCVLKMNAVNAYLGPFLEKAFAAAVERGYLAVVQGGADVGAYLVEHPQIDEIHITGSDRTHDAIVWGPPGPESAARRKRRSPLLKKPISSELGNISPVLLVPGPYTDDEIAFQAQSIAAGILNNASFNCNAVKLLVLPKGCESSGKLLDAVQVLLERAPLRKAYYPGAEQRWRELVDAHSDAVRIGHPKRGELPWAIIRDLDPRKRDEKCFRMEPFCGVVSETRLGSADPVEFLEQAVRFVNERVWGTLNATLIVHPKTAAGRRTGAAVEKAIADLRYGAVSVNHWAALVYGFVSTPWGGHPSSTLHDIQSGRGFVHNTYMLEGIEKAVVRGPLTVRPKPVWFAGHRTAHEVARKMIAMMAEPSWTKLPGVVLAALRG
jgi:aldehyde dehydrogenase (NAD(P)+)